VKWKELIAEFRCVAQLEVVAFRTAASNRRPGDATPLDCGLPRAGERPIAVALLKVVGDGSPKSRVVWDCSPKQVVNST
jgi:hypothetical protein